MVITLPPPYDSFLGECSPPVTCSESLLAPGGVIIHRLDKHLPVSPLRRVLVKGWLQRCCRLPAAPGSCACGGVACASFFRIYVLLLTHCFPASNTKCPPPLSCNQSYFLQPRIVHVVPPSAPTSTHPKIFPVPTVANKTCIILYFCEIYWRDLW